jgi:hypothetical protein
MHKNTVDSE